MRLSICLLGRFSVAVDGVVVPDALWRRDRSAALLKLLAVTPSHRLHREQIMEAFWPDLEIEAAGANLRKAVYYARRALGVPALLDTAGPVVALAPEADLEIDAELFDLEARNALRNPTPERCAAAASLYGGALLPDDRYVEWLEAPRTQLQQRYVDVLRAGGLWRELIALDPTDEEAQCAQMQAALDAGNRAEAIRLFTHLRERLRLDLGVGPSRAAVALYERALATDGGEPVSVRDRVRGLLARGLVDLQSGEFERAGKLGRQARDLALGAGLGREVGEASALVGLVAHTQGHWQAIFRTEFVDWVQTRPDNLHHVFEGHLCLAEFCLCASSGHEEVGVAAQELLAVAETAQSDAGKGLAALILGKAEMFSGRLDAAEALLTEAGEQLERSGVSSGRPLVTELLANIALQRGQKWRAGRLVQQALTEARKSWMAPHLLIRLQALALKVAPSGEKALAAIAEGDRLLRDGACQICSMDLRTASAIALIGIGKLDQVDRRLEEAERIAGMWHGGPWAAALWEARGLQRQAQGQKNRATAAFEEAADRFGALHRPLDQARCLGHIAPAAQAAGA